MVSAERGGEIDGWLRGRLEWFADSMGIELARRLARRGDMEPWDIR